MILADKITELRKKNGWSQEELADKLDVSRQSISKWESAQSIPDMSRILKLSEVFGVSTDLLLKDNLEILDDWERESVDTVDPYGYARAVSMEEAAGFLSFRGRFSGRIAFGVLLCILSPVLLIVLSGLQVGGLLAISEMAAVAIGLIVLLAMIGTAVAIFVIYSLQGQRYEYLEKETIDTEYGVDGMVRDRREKYRQSYSIVEERLDGYTGSISGTDEEGYVIDNHHDPLPEGRSVEEEIVNLPGGKARKEAVVSTVITSKVSRSMPVRTSTTIRKTMSAKTSDSSGTMKTSMDEMSIGARKINESGSELSQISEQMKDSITDIGGQIDQFTV